MLKTFLVRPVSDQTGEYIGHYLKWFTELTDWFICSLKRETSSLISVLIYHNDHQFILACRIHTSTRYSLTAGRGHGNLGTLNVNLCD